MTSLDTEARDMSQNKQKYKRQLERLILSILPEPSSDFRLQSEGSILMIHPRTEAAVEWVNRRIGQNNGYQPLWPSVLVEAGYALPILEAIASDGLNVA